MITDFSVIYGETVPKNYFWDLGPPLQTVNTFTTADVFLQNDTPSISGYAPGLRVLFGNTSFSDQGFNFIDYKWDFGDFYHQDNNIVSLSCSTGVTEHTYIMPGTYTVSLRHIQSKGLSELDQTGNARLCLGKYNIRWFWDELRCLDSLGGDNLSKLTWDETMCVPPLTAANPKPKWWANETECFQKYCKFWSWYDLKCEGGNPVVWSETDSDALFEKRWAFEANDTICTVNSADFLNTTQTFEQTVFKTVVTVKEIMPVASMYSVSAITGPSPLAVQLTPRNCKPGSFPIDRIDWDFGDGSPIKTITRYTSIQNDPEVINTRYFGADLNDVRNYDVLHTYTRNIDIYPVFYPSLTCYSANTHSYDTCSMTVGPINLIRASTIENFNILKTRNTLKGNIYAFNVNNNISVITTNETKNPLIPKFTSPLTVIRNTQGIFQDWFGYNGANYPLPYTPSCLPPVDIPFSFRIITTEDPTPFNITDNLSAEPGIPITTEGSAFIVT